MRATLSMLFVSVFAVISASPALAAGEKKKEPAAAAAPAGKEVTLSGTMMCAKCALKESDKCQSVLKVTEAGKDVKYYLTHNDVAENNHEQACGGGAKATVKGTVKTEGGKKLLTASEIKFE